ncbi:MULTISPECIES: sigma-70 family RNA polymerase sigma factor [Kribbella]|uniref:RNA polymerase sigma factor (Sigma-70 family) n=1 Tax=Kribbella pratensis TaxID=2512112 RepID=A0ABY2F7U1_9ACTN|nr:MULTISPECIES: sigma-70 family RNA polymerase sigma factor [Kribbella]TDW79491.1 RNA polymerase sigma factor (sigma-70 family) [Kribbella sp. VKM Ac-2566]TDW84355.1 RNA polymerase sigma factor (sigma-70 family) [Kribbella pratensis]
MNTGLSSQRWEGGETWPDRPASAEQWDGGLEEAVETFVRVRPRLMAIGYRFLANWSEAEDVVQETWLRWQNTDRTVVADPQALLATMATRLAINISLSARRRYEVCRTPPVPPATDVNDDPATTAERREAVEQALLIVLESLTPRERAAFILREAFGYSYGQISEFLQLGAANTRQVVSRARRHLGANRRVIVSSASYQRFLQAFFTAARTGDLGSLERLLAADLTVDWDN